MTWTSAHDNNVLSAPDQRAIDQLDATIKALGKIRAAWPKAARVLRDAQAGAPRAQSYDGIGRSTGSAWCWTHLRDHRECKTDNDCDTQTCRVETIAVHDPTGEAAMTGDRAANTANELRKQAARIVRHVDTLTQIIEAAAPQQRTATSLERRRTAADNGKGCESCARVDGPTPGIAMWSPVSRPRTTANGNLATTADICSWCYRYTLDLGTLPSRAALAAHHNGQRVMRDA